MRSVLIILFISIFSTEMYSQEKVIIADFNVVNGDTIFLADIPEVEIFAFKDKDERNKYYILKRRVLKVYPYALVAKEKLHGIQEGLDTIPKRRHKKRYTKEVAKWVKEEYTKQLKNLTMSEGKILVKRTLNKCRSLSYSKI